MARKYLITEDEFMSLHVNEAGDLVGERDNGDPVNFGNVEGRQGEPGERGLPGLNAVPTDEAVSVMVSAPDSATGAALRTFFPVLRGSSGAIPVDKGAGRSYIDWGVTGTGTGYAIHIVASAGFEGSGLIGLGNDNGTKPALLVNNKAAGSGITLDNMPSMTGGVGFYGLNRTPNAVLMHLAAGTDDAAALLQITGRTSHPTNQLVKVQTAAGTIIHELTQERARWRGPQGAETRLAHTTAADRRMYAPNAGAQFVAVRERVDGTSGRWSIAVADRVGAGAIGTEEYKSVIEVQPGGSGTTRLGFFEATPVVKPSVSGARGGNVALASLLTALANLGLIENGTVA